MRILVSNDDGINASGLKALEKIAHELSDEVWVVAPELDQSGASHSLTLRDPLRIREISEHKFAINGTPSDCVMIAVNHMLKDKKPNLVLSGINHGANLGDDITYSGTVAAAMEATYLGIPAVAMSLVVETGHPAKWSTVEHYAPDIVRKFLEVKMPKAVFINVNFPNVIASSVAAVQITRQGQRKVGDNLIERFDPRGRPYYWIGGVHYGDDAPEGTDIAAIGGNAISITPLCLDLTHTKTATLLEQVFC